MLVVGLTGGIASGKSTVSRMFADAGIPVICADELAREAVKPGSAALDEIRRAFGQKVLDEDGNLDRAGMARLVFQDTSKRKLLESIIHPRVAEEQENRLRRLEREGHHIAVIDVPLLYESGWDKAFDLIIVVYVPRNIQERRLVDRDKISPADAQSRLDAQMPIEEKKKSADRVVDNTGSMEHTLDQVKGILEELQALERSKAVEMKTGSQ
ncbi:MAG: dephospho-CoA kinase [Desulfomonile tiedjei]|nr:dephospho-CoA kinase [Desulfomonile tiedjei]